MVTLKYNTPIPASCQTVTISPLSMACYRRQPNSVLIFFCSSELKFTCVCNGGVSVWETLRTKLHVQNQIYRDENDRNWQEAPADWFSVIYRYSNSCRATAIKLQIAVSPCWWYKSLLFFLYAYFYLHATLHIDLENAFFTKGHRVLEAI